MKAILFDLDDTLYPEIDYVKSGFRAVARYLSVTFSFDQDRLADKMFMLLQKHGRGRVFDILLDELGVYSPERISLLVYLYRCHQPVIHLYKDTIPTFQSLRYLDLQIGIITDGMGSVQRRKIAALGLEALVDVVLYTDELGKEHWKPSTVPYCVSLELCRVEPIDAAYIGDNPLKDFAGANTLGMTTIQIDRQQTGESFPVEGFAHASRAKYMVNGLQDILPIIAAKE